MGKQEAVRRLSATISLRSEARLQANSDALLESVECKVFVVKLETSLSHFLAQGFIVEEKGYFIGYILCQCRLVAGFNQHSITPLHHHFWDSALVGRYNGQMLLHGLKQDERETLVGVIGGEYEDVGML